MFYSVYRKTNEVASDGFSLIEILICVAIIAILSSISFVFYQGSVDISDIKFSMRDILNDLNSYQNIAKEKNAVVIVKFIIGTSKIQVTVQLDESEIQQNEKDFRDYGLLKRRLIFRKYMWENGAKTPSAFFYYPNGQIKGGVVYFGTAFAEAEIRVQGDRIISDL